jgi:2-isopropylmalate synthase
MKQKKHIQIFDTTLRDGAQMPGVSFSARDKLAIAERLDDMGIDFIEGGFPASNEKDRHFFAQAQKRKWKHAKICSFGSTHHKKFTPNNDPCLAALIESATPVVVLFGKSSKFHAEKILEVSPEKNLEIIEGSVRKITKNGQQVIFDAEHFFDGFLADPEYSMQCLLAAERGGAINLTLADTNGGILPEQIQNAIAEVQKKVHTPLGIHAHNDSDLAVANSLTAISSGATLVQGTINGIGERCGNANLCSIIPNLQLKMGYDILKPKKLIKLTDLSRFVQELCNLRPRKDLPYVGLWAFRHKGGMHVSAMRKTPKSYQHVLPETVGNQSSTSISELSGKANITQFLEEKHIAASVQMTEDILTKVKAKEKEGLTYEGGEASLEILCRTEAEYKSLPFELIDYFVRNQGQHGEEHPEYAIEATVRLKANGKEIHTAGIGNGPVNALDTALRKALEPEFPLLKDINLVDYKVRIIDISLGTCAKIRVQIETADSNGTTWRTVGCSQNIIAASMQALLDSYTFSVWNGNHSFS